MDKEQLYARVQTMIQSSAGKPKWMSISTVTVAGVLGVSREEVEQGLAQLVEEGRLRKEKLDKSPNTEVYMLG